MEISRILVAMSKEASAEKMKTILTVNGYTVIDQAQDGRECIRKMRILMPDITILEYELPQLNGYEVARVALEDHLCDVILIASTAQQSLAGDLISEGGVVCLTKPLNKPVFFNTLDLMVKNKKRVAVLKKEIEDLRNTLRERKEVDKAKRLLMGHLKVSEQEAFRRIQKQSMDKGVPMAEIAKAILLAYEI